MECYRQELALAIEQETRRQAGQCGQPATNPTGGGTGTSPTDGGTTDPTTTDPTTTGPLTGNPHPIATIEWYEWEAINNPTEPAEPEPATNPHPVGSQAYDAWEVNNNPSTDPVPDPVDTIQTDQPGNYYHVTRKHKETWGYKVGTVDSRKMIWMNNDAVIDLSQGYYYHWGTPAAWKESWHHFLGIELYDLFGRQLYINDLL